MGHASRDKRMPTNVALGLHPLSKLVICGPQKTLNKHLLDGCIAEDEPKDASKDQRENDLK
jgi:hypothetical protein